MDEDLVNTVGPMGSAVHRRRWPMIAVMAALIALLAGAALVAASGTSTVGQTPLVGRTGRPAPSFTLPSVTSPGTVVSLASLRGTPLVINFWASWCTPCRAEMPLLEAAFRNSHGRVRFIGIDSNDSPGPARAFLREIGVTYPALSDTDGQIAISYGLFGLPTTVFVSASGAVLGRSIGELHAGSLPSALHEAFHF
jgi:cytochrome c biogenesis protein CcmG/thiol:disulfide interchange protein DsbE